MQTRRLGSVDLGMDFFAAAYQYRYDPNHEHQPKGGGEWEKTLRGWRILTEKMKVPEGVKPEVGVGEIVPEQVQAPAKSPYYGMAPWHGREKEILLALNSDDSTRPPDERWKEDSGGHINHLVFEKFIDGERAAVKSEDREEKPSSVRPGKLSDNASQARREKLAYDIDEVLGLGVVPPTTYAKKTLPEGKKETCSAQHFVRGRKWGDLRLADIQSEGIKKSIQRIAALDIITGATDRHAGNCIVDKDGDKAYAIDNGLSFPKKGAENRVRSVALSKVRDNKNNYMGEDYNVADDDEGIQKWSEYFDDDLLKHLATVDEKKFKGLFVEAKLKDEGDAAWKRLQSFVKRVKAQEPVKPSHVEAYREMKEADPRQLEEFGNRIHKVYFQQHGELSEPTLQDRDRVKTFMNHLNDDEVRRNVDANANKIEKLLNRAFLLKREAGKLGGHDKNKAEDYARMYYNAARQNLLNKHKRLDKGGSVKPVAPAPAPVQKPVTPAPAPAPVPAPKEEKHPRQKVPRSPTPEILRVVSSERLARELLRTAREILQG